MPSYDNPRRLACNCPGDFYATGDNPPPGTEALRNSCIGDCLACGGPEEHAEDLLAVWGDSNINTFFVRQPGNEDEIERACKALQSCCVSALRYGGDDRGIVMRLGNDPSICDSVLSDEGSLVYCLDVRGGLLPWATEIRDAICYGLPRPPIPLSSEDGG
jgi:hypothetical protein